VYRLVILHQIRVYDVPEFRELQSGIYGSPFDDKGGISAGSVNQGSIDAGERLGIDKGYVDLFPVYVQKLPDNVREPTQGLPHLGRIFTEDLPVHLLLNAGFMKNERAARAVAQHDRHNGNDLDRDRPFALPESLFIDHIEMYAPSGQ